MEDLLRRQTEHLNQIVGLLRTDRILQTIQTVESRQILSDEDKLVKKLDSISESVKSIDSKITAGNVQQLSQENESAKESETASNKHLEALKKIQETLSKNNQYRDIANKAKDEPIFKSIGDKFRDLKESVINIKNNVTGVSLKSIGQGIASSVSPRYKDRLEYMKNEKNLGSRKHEKTMKKDYAERSRMLQRNVKNEDQLLKSRGSLSEEDYLKGDTKGAREYLKEKDTIGKGLKKTDSRYSIDEKVAAREEKAAAKLANKFRSSTDTVGSVVSTQASTIAPMVNANMASQETAIETDRSTKDYQETQLHNAEESNKLLTDQLDVQKEILELMKKIPTTSSGEGIGGIPAAVAEGVGAAGIGASAAKAVGKVGSVVKKAGSTALRAMGSVARVAAVPLAVGVAGAAAASYAANEYSDSFGEGGFDLVKKLHDDKVIDYNATVMGYNPSEILDWKAIEALPPKDLKTLMDSGVEFSREDTSKLHELYTKEMIASGGSDAAAKATPEATKPEGTKPEGTTPEATKPEDVSTSTSSHQEGISVAGIPVVKGQPLTSEQVAATDLAISMGNKPSAEIQEAYDLAKSPQIKPEVVTLEATKAVPVKLNSQLSTEEISSARDEKEIADLENKAAQLEGAGLTSGKFEAGQLVPPEPTKPEAITPSSATPTAADTVYNKSAETAISNKPAAANVNNVIAPTTNVSSSTAKTIMKTDVRNNESSINRLFSNRLSFQ